MRCRHCYCCGVYCGRNHVHAQNVSAVDSTPLFAHGYTRCKLPIWVVTRSWDPETVHIPAVWSVRFRRAPNFAKSKLLASSCLYILDFKFFPFSECCVLSFWVISSASEFYVPTFLNTGDSRKNVQGGSNMTETDLCVNKPHCAAAVRPWESEATTSTLPPARVRTCSVLSGSC